MPACGGGPTGGTQGLPEGCGKHKDLQLKARMDESGKHIRGGSKRDTGDQPWLIHRADH